MRGEVGGNGDVLVGSWNAGLNGKWESAGKHELLAGLLLDEILISWLNKTAIFVSLEAEGFCDWF